MDWVGAAVHEQDEMLDAIGVSSVDELIASVPAKLEGLLKIPAGMSEPELLRHLTALAAKNNPCEPGKCFLGAGAYEHAIPSAIDTLISRGEFSTAYTPYQPEASQGTLIATFEFQTMIAEITGMDVANASMYDGPSAMAEAALLAIRHTKRRKIIISGGVHPEWLKVTQTYLQGVDSEVVIAGLRDGVTDSDSAAALIDGDTACVIAQQPNFFGCLEDMRNLVEQAHKVGALFVSAANPISLGLITPPGEIGADIAVGDTQTLGISLNYGGPYAGYFAVRQALVRQAPGRLAGMSWDGEGRRGFTLTLQTREQHIRREKATSNICTNQALLALTSTIYLALVGKEGFREVGRLNLLGAHYAADKLTEIDGMNLAFEQPFFNEFALRLPKPAGEVIEAMDHKGYWAGYDLKVCEMPDCLLVAVTETKTKDDIDAFVAAMREVIS